MTKNRKRRWWQRPPGTARTGRRPVQLKICGFWVQDRADELPFSSAET